MNPIPLLSFATLFLLPQLINSTIKTLPILLIAALVLVAIRRNTALRHQVGFCALFALLLLPAINLLIPRASLPVSIGANWNPFLTQTRIIRRTVIASPHPVGKRGTATKRAEEVNNFRDSAASARASADTIPWSAETTPLIIQLEVPVWAICLTVLYAVVAFFRIAMLVAACCAIFRLNRRSRPAGDHPQSILLEAARALKWTQEKMPALRIAPKGTDAPLPLMWGYPKSTILLPEDVSQWSNERLRIVLLHECAHALRGDWLLHLTVQIVCALYWFHPLVWLFAHRLHTDGERACDDRVLATGVAPAEYATHLIEIARVLRPSRFMNGNTIVTDSTHYATQKGSFNV